MVEIQIYDQKYPQKLQEIANLLFIHPSLLSEDPPSKIIENIYLGSQYNSANLEELQQLKITHILNVSAQNDSLFEQNFKYLHFKVYDEEKEKIIKYFDKAFAFISSALTDTNNRVFIHCQSGISRSSAFTIAFLMKQQGIGLTEAKNLVKQQRSIIKPNQGFVSQLIQYEVQLYGKIISN